MGSVLPSARLRVSLPGLGHAQPGLVDGRMVVVSTSFDHLGAWGGKREAIRGCKNNVFCSQLEKEDVYACLCVCVERQRERDAETERDRQRQRGRERVTESLETQAPLEFL